MLRYGQKCPFVGHEIAGTYSRIFFCKFAVWESPSWLACLVMFYYVNFFLRHRQHSTGNNESSRNKLLRWSLVDTNNRSTLGSLDRSPLFLKDPSRRGPNQAEWMPGPFLGSRACVGQWNIVYTKGWDCALTFLQGQRIFFYIFFLLVYQYQ